MSETVSLPGSAGLPLPGGSDIDGLVAALHSTDGLAREKAREALVTVGHAAVGSLIYLLNDRHDYVRWEAAKALKEIADPAAAEALVTILEDQDAGVRWVAAEGLVAVKRASLRPLLKALIARPESPWLREGAHHVLRTLTKLGLDAGVAPVLLALHESAPAATLPAIAHRALDAIA